MDSLIVLLQIVLLLALSLTPTLERIFPLPARFEVPDIVHCLSLLGIAWSLFLVALGGFGLGRFARISPKPAIGSVLRTTGAYAFSRHPMYTGMMGAAFFWSSYLASPFAYLCTALLVGVFYVKVKKEEAYLSKLFGLEYINYSKEVGMFFPKKF